MGLDEQPAAASGAGPCTPRTSRSTSGSSSDNDHVHDGSPTRQEFIASEYAERCRLLSDKSAGGCVTGLPDPLLHLAWSAPAIAAAAAGGPHVDATGQPDPRTVQSLEAALVAAGAQAVSVGLFQFPDDNSLHQAILALFRRHPWVRHADASHGAVGDVVEASVSIAWQARRGMSFAHLVYFNV